MQRTHPILLVTILLIVVGATHALAETAKFSGFIPLAANGKASTPTQPPVDTLAYRREVIRLVNEYRAANGCPAAPENTTLMDAAQAWSDYMQSNNIYGHSTEVDPEWYEHHSYPEGAHENIGIGQDTPQEVVTAWKNSPNHNRTLLWCYYSNNGYVYDLGVGLNGRLWTLALGERLP
jgi:uncharacterized protein YkwD